MAHVGKRYKKILEKVGTGARSLSDAISFLQENTACKFDETLEVAINLDLDPKHADQNIRGMVTMPGGIGKTVKVAVFAKGAAADAAW